MGQENTSHLSQMTVLVNTWQSLAIYNPKGF